MNLRPLAVPSLVLIMLAAGCGSDPPPPPAPPPAEQPAAAPDTAGDGARAAEEARRRAEEARRRAIADARNTLEALVYFDYDMADITSEAERLLRDKVDVLRNSPDVRLMIEGHADERGSTEYNLALGNRRAESVRSFFTSFGLNDGRFETVSFGEERPADMGQNEAAWARNRRAAFRITAGADMINPSQEP